MTGHASSSVSADYNITVSTNDAGGKRTSSADYTNDGSTGGIVGVSTEASSAETAKHGYIGQLYEVTGLQVTGASSTVNEGSTLQLAARQSLDDASLLAVPATSIIWSVQSGPIADINSSGLVTAAIVYQNTPAVVSGSYAGLTGALGLSVINVNIDDFGTYAGDGIDDAWQVQYFGLNNPLAGPLADPDGDGQNNLFEYTAGVVPTDNNSRFLISIANIAGQPAQKNLMFSPRFNDRTYTVQTSLTLGSSAVWGPLTTFTSSDNGLVRTVTDTDATGRLEFYRVAITKP